MSNVESQYCAPVLSLIWCPFFALHYITSARTVQGAFFIEDDALDHS